MRLFFGIPLAGDALAVAQLAQDALRVRARLSFARRDQLHLTLAFLGEQASDEPAREAGRAAAAVAQVAQIELGEPGAFPDAGRPRVLFIGLRQGAEALAALADKLRAALRSRGVSFDAKPFRAHATLARAELRELRNAARALQALEVRPARQLVDSFALFQSRGGVHALVERFALAGGA